MSGSFVASGSGSYRATKVGRDAYAARLAEEASKFTLVKSELNAGINKILRFITYLMIPAGLLIIYNQLFSSGESLGPALSGMVAALVPMVPEGLVLMTSIAFAVGVVRLGRRQCLVQELPAIEGLARVDVVCADKTGTLTENGMRLSDLEPLDGSNLDEARAALAALAADDPRPNASVLAIAEAFPTAPGWGEPPRSRRSRRRRSGAASRTAPTATGCSAHPTCCSTPAPRRRDAPRNSARAGCGCCSSHAATARSTTNSPPARSRPSRSSSSNSGCARTRSRPSSTSPASRSTSRSSPATTRSPSVRSPRRSACRVVRLPSTRVPCRRARTNSPTSSKARRPSAGSVPIRSARWSARCSRAATPSR